MHEHSRAVKKPGGALRSVTRLQDAGRAADTDEPEPPRRSGARLAMIEPPGGESLRSLLVRRASGAALLRHLLCAMRGAAALHKRGVVHGDIRPENIFLAPDAGNASSFVRARAARLDPEPVARLLHRPGEPEPPGVQAYRAPEQRAGWLLDPRTDVYGFGVVLHEVLTGRLPHHLHAPPRAGSKPTATSLGPDSDHVPAGLARLVRRALQPDPALRPNSVSALMAAIEPYTRHPALRGALPPRPRPVERAPDSARRSLRARLSAMFAVLALAGAVGTAALRPDLAARVSTALHERDLGAQLRTGLTAASALLPGMAPSVRAPQPELVPRADLARK